MARDRYVVFDISHGVVRFAITDNLRIGQRDGTLTDCLRLVAFNGMHIAVAHASYNARMANIDGRIETIPTEVNDIARNRSIVLLCRSQCRTNPQRIASVQRSLPCRALEIERSITHPELNTFTSAGRGRNTIARHIRCPKQPVHEKLTPLTTCIVKVLEIGVIHLY